jgi:hypothetical protein
MGHKWDLPIDKNWPASGSSIGTSGGGIGAGIDTSAPILTEGAVAYWKRKQAMWGDLMKKADVVFRNCNPAYDSPL